MAIALRHRDDPVQPLPPLAGMVVRREASADLMSALQGRPAAEMARRMEAGHRAYVAWRGGEPAAFGWVATRSAEIGEMGASFAIPAGERYLWNFVTLPAHRGAGIYPRLLDAIVRAESAGAARFWIAYAPENHASGAGIRKAGFAAVAELSFAPDGRPALRPSDDGAADAARVLGMPTVEGPLSPCWRCARAAAPASPSCAGAACCCDYQRREVDCAA